MSQNVGVFVDVSNLFYSAKSAGVEVNYCRLLEHAVAGRDLIRACAYTGVDPDNANQRKFIDFLRANGYKVVCKDIHKYEGGRIKANLDIEMAVDIMLLSENLDVIVLVSGDGDFVRLLEAVQMRGVRCEVIGFGISTSNELIEVADQFTEIGSMPGIFRNAPSGPGVYFRPSGNPGESKGAYAFSPTAGLVNGVQPEHVSGERERERARMRYERGQHAPYWETRDHRQPVQAGANGNGSGNGSGQGNGTGNGHDQTPNSAAEQSTNQSEGYIHATHDEFMLPDGEPCGDMHSVAISRETTLIVESAAVQLDPNGLTAGDGRCGCNDASTAGGSASRIASERQ